MTEFDLLCLSLGVNIGLLYNAWRQSEKIRLLSFTMRAIPKLMAEIADGNAMPYRTPDKEIHIKEVKREKTKPSAPTV